MFPAEITYNEFQNIYKLIYLLGTMEIPPVQEQLENGYYTRTTTLAAGHVAIGMIWKVPHIFQLLQGKAYIVQGNMRMLVEAPFIINCSGGVQRMMIAHTDCVLATVVATAALTCEEAIASCATKSLKRLQADRRIQ